METTYSSLYILGTSVYEIQNYTDIHAHIDIHCTIHSLPIYPSSSPNFITQWHQLLSFQQLLFAAIEPQHEILQHWHNT